MPHEPDYNQLATEAARTLLTELLPELIEQKMWEEVGTGLDPQDDEHHVHVGSAAEAVCSVMYDGLSGHAALDSLYRYIQGRPDITEARRELWLTTLKRHGATA